MSRKYFQLSFRILIFSAISILSLPAIYGQKAYEYNLQLLDQSTKEIQKTIDIFALNPYEFLATSIVIEGTNLNQNIIKGSLYTSNSYPLKLAHENVDIADKFVSELYFIPKDTSGNLTIKIDLGEENSRISDISARVRIFIPEGAKQLENEQKPFINPILTDECACTMLPYVPREVWGARFNLDHDIYKPPAVYTQVTHLIIHHSAGTNFSNDWAGVVAAYFDYHVNSNGWQDIGYNWLIDPNGVLYEGRGGGDNIQGAHMCGYNKNSMGICMLGNFEVATPSDTMMQVLTKLLSFKACKENIDPLGHGDISSWPGHMHHISGHQDGCSPNYTSCPGQYLYEKLNTIRLSTNAFIHTACDTTSSTINIENYGRYLYPNPATNIICGVSNVISIRNILGIEMNSDKRKMDNTCLDISNLLPGIYYLSELHGDKILTTPFVKE